MTPRVETQEMTEQKEKLCISGRPRTSRRNTNDIQEISNRNRNLSSNFTQGSIVLKTINLGDMIHDKEILEMRIQSLEAENEIIRNERETYEKKLEEKKEEIRRIKRDRLTAEKKNKEFEEQKHLFILEDKRNNLREGHLNVQNQVLAIENKSLTEALADAEQECRRLLRQKQKNLSKMNLLK